MSVGNAKKFNLKTNWPTERSEGAAASTRTQDTLEIWSNGSVSLFYILSFWGDLYFLIPYVFLHLNMIQNILNIENEWNVHQPCASWPQELCNGALPFHLTMFAFSFFIFLDKIGVIGFTWGDMNRICRGVCNNRWWVVLNFSSLTLIIKLILKLIVKRISVILDWCGVAWGIPSGRR